MSKIAIFEVDFFEIQGLDCGFWCWFRESRPGWTNWRNKFEAGTSLWPRNRRSKNLKIDFSRFLGSKFLKTGKIAWCSLKLLTIPKFGRRFHFWHSRVYTANPESTIQQNSTSEYWIELKNGRFWFLWLSDRSENKRNRLSRVDYIRLGYNTETWLDGPPPPRYTDNFFYINQFFVWCGDPESTSKAAI